MNETQSAADRAAAEQQRSEAAVRVEELEASRRALASSVIKGEVSSEEYEELLDEIDRERRRIEMADLASEAVADAEIEEQRQAERERIAADRARYDQLSAKRAEIAARTEMAATELVEALSELSGVESERIALAEELPGFARRLPDPERVIGAWVSSKIGAWIPRPGTTMPSVGARSLTEASSLPETAPSDEELSDRSQATAEQRAENLELSRRRREADEHTEDLVRSYMTAMAGCSTAPEDQRVRFERDEVLPQIVQEFGERAPDVLAARGLLLSRPGQAVANAS